MLATLLGRKTTTVAAVTAADDAEVPPLSVITSEPSFISLKVRLHQQLIDILDLPVVERTPHEQLEREVGGIIRDLLKRETAFNLSEQGRKQLIADVLDELLGFGALEPLLKDHTVNDIIVNTYDQVCVERGGKTEITDRKSTRLNSSHSSISYAVFCLK